jgi:CheY-like chemotaxis protein
MTLSETDILEASILIVDDQDSNIRLLEQILSDAGYSRVTRRGIRSRSVRCIKRTPTT